VRVLLYAPVDLNVIDGSAIWCVSVAQMLALDPAISLDILLERPLFRDVNIGALSGAPRIGLLDSDTGQRLARTRWLTDDKPGSRLGAERALDRIVHAHCRESYDLIILRGADICRMAAQNAQLAARSWFYFTQHGLDLATLDALSRSNARLACQTPLVQEFLEQYLGCAPGRYVPLPPMIPRRLREAARSGTTGRRLCYVGKFDPDYRVEEMIGCFSRLRAEHPEAEFVIAGDKFYCPSDPRGFRQRVTRALESTPGVQWRGALSRVEVGQLMLASDIGCCWRSAEHDDSLELSTKALEYGAAGLPVLLNPSRISRLVFGDDYPLFTESAESFVEALRRAFADPQTYAQASRVVFEAAGQFTFESVNRALQPYLQQASRSSGWRSTRGPRRIVFAGHDLKFASSVIDHFSAHDDCIVRIDQWAGHERHDERESEELLRWADVIWCEWCAGNAVWYSQRMRPSQRLIVRLHRYEITTSAPDEVAWENVSTLITIAPHVRNALLSRLGHRLEPICRLVYNIVDCEHFERPKSDKARYQLGLLGYCPKLKHPRLAAEILLRLRAHDNRWRLLAAGRRPNSYAWIWGDPEERQYYEQFEAFIESEQLGNYVVRQDWTDEPAEWFRGVGYILSCSDVEGSHQAVAEGMASGAVPIVRLWEGADVLYPNAALFRSADEAAKAILSISVDDRWLEMSGQAAREARRRFDRPLILQRLEEILLGETRDDTCQQVALAGTE